MILYAFPRVNKRLIFKIHAEMQYKNAVITAVLWNMSNNCVFEDYNFEYF